MFIPRMNVQLDGVAANPFSIFQIADECMEEILKTDSSEKQLIQNLYADRVIPLLKKTIPQRPIHFAIKAAAEKGKAAQAAFKAIQEIMEGQNTIYKKEISNHPIFLDEARYVLFKQGDPRSIEEEANINSLFDLMSKGAVVSSFTMNKPSIDQFQIKPSSPEEEARSFSLDDLTENLLQKMKDKNRLSSFDFESLIVHLSNPSRSSITFLLSPDFINPEKQAAYEQCEKFDWSYRDECGNVQIVNFKTLHSLYLQKKIKGNLTSIGETTPRPTLNQLTKALKVKLKVLRSEVMALASHQSKCALSDIPAKPFIKEMLVMDQLIPYPKAKEELLSRLTPDAQFNAILTGELQFLDLHGKNLGFVPESNEDYEFFKERVFFVSHEPFNPRNPLSFRNSFSFNELIIKYLNEDISLDTPIEYMDGGKCIRNRLARLPNLKNALDVHWKLVIFDTDSSLSEDNRLLQIFKKSRAQHLIPLRSAFLGSNWKDTVLNDETIERLAHSEEREMRVSQWIKREDAPIYKQLSPETRTYVSHYLTPILREYELSSERKAIIADYHKCVKKETDLKDMAKSLEDRLNEFTKIFKEKLENLTVKSLKEKFIQDICNLDTHEEFWKCLEAALSIVPVRENDTWESLGRRYKQSVEVLKRLNPQVLKLEHGEKITIRYDLTSFSPEIVKKREHIASQLFPRITVRQQTALFERQQHRTTYLNNYEKLKNTPLQNQDLLNQIKTFVNDPSTPLSSLEREKFIQNIETNERLFLAQPAQLLELKEKVCKKCQPTYFNIQKAMYPLLADAYELNRHLGQSPEMAGTCIGAYYFTLEEAIVQSNRVPNPSVKKLTTILKSKITTTDPSS